MGQTELYPTSFIHTDGARYGERENRCRLRYWQNSLIGHRLWEKREQEEGGRGGGEGGLRGLGEGGGGLEDFGRLLVVGDHLPSPGSQQSA